MGMTSIRLSSSALPMTSRRINMTFGLTVIGSSQAMIGGERSLMV
jgi:hypothetical protein